MVFCLISSSLPSRFTSAVFIAVLMTFYLWFEVFIVSKLKCVIEGVQVAQMVLDFR